MKCSAAAKNRFLKIFKKTAVFKNRCYLDKCIVSHLAVIFTQIIIKTIKFPFLP